LKFLLNLIYFNLGIEVPLLAQGLSPLILGRLGGLKVSFKRQGVSSCYQLEGLTQDLGR